MARNPESKTVTDFLIWGDIFYNATEHGKHLLYSAVFLASSFVFG